MYAGRLSTKARDWRTLSKQSPRPQEGKSFVDLRISSPTGPSLSAQLLPSTHLGQLFHAGGVFRSHTGLPSALHKAPTHPLTIPGAMGSPRASDPAAETEAWVLGLAVPPHLPDGAALLSLLSFGLGPQSLLPDQYSPGPLPPVLPVNLGPGLQG